jgi:hypothetical protein
LEKSQECFLRSRRVRIERSEDFNGSNREMRQWKMDVVQVCQYPLNKRRGYSFRSYPKSSLLQDDESDKHEIAKTKNINSSKGVLIPTLITISKF